MNKWQVSDIRWASVDDLKLPFWRDWNKANPLPGGFWQRIWEYPYAAIHIPRDAQVIDVGGTYPFVLFKSFPKDKSVDIRNLNKVDHPLLKGQWPKGSLIISDAANIPLKDNSFDYAVSISAIEEMPNTVKVLKEMIRLAKTRVVVTVDVSEELGVNRLLMRELEDYLGIKIPPVPSNVLRSNHPQISQFNQPALDTYKHIRVLGLVIDAVKTVKEVGIIIPHWESYAFADACIRGINSQKNKNVKEQIYLIDDYSKDQSFQKLKKKYAKANNITFKQIKRADHDTNADVGYLLDEGLKLVSEPFVAMIDADTIPLSRDWLTFPIWILEKYGASSVGLDTGLSSSYSKQPGGKNTWWQPDGGYSIRGGLYDNNWFTVTNNLYRVMRTATAKVVSQSIGFTRGKPKNVSQSLLQKAAILASRIMKKPNQNDPNDRSPYLPVGCDNGVAANHFIDINRLGPKFNIPLTSYIGLTSQDGAYGQNISGLLFHFALSTRALSLARREVLNPGKDYEVWIREIQSKGEISPKLAQKMIAQSRRFKPGGYDGSVPTSWYKTEYRYLQKLLSKFHQSSS